MLTSLQRHVNVTSTFAKVYYTLTRVDVGGIFQNLDVDAENGIFQKWKVNVTSTFWKADYSILLVDV